MTNRDAFLTMLGQSEGTTTIEGSDRGYNVLVGGTLFNSYADHPRILVDLGNGLQSTAAGRYQILEHNYDAYKAQLSLPDFSPASQDAIALQMIKECGALDDIDEGYVTVAIAKCSGRWASLPGNGYGQRTTPTVKLVSFYVGAGGAPPDTASTDA